MSFAGFRACLIYICLTVYEFSFILLIHHIILLILISVLSVTFWTLTYYKKNIFFWSRTVWYETLELFILWHVWKCFGVLWVNSYQLAVHSRESCMIEQALLPHWLCNQSTHQGICSCSPIVNFFKFTFHHGMATSVIFLIKNNLNRHIKHENLLSIYENMDYFQIMLFIVTCSKFQKI